MKQIFSRYYCPVCKNKLDKFRSITDHLTEQFNLYSFSYPIDSFETLNHKSYSCPHCGCSDRDRLIFEFIKKSTRPKDFEKEGLSILEFAPSPKLGEAIKNLTSRISYSTADLYMPGVDKKVDICNMKKTYTDDSFDIIICSHVLEHVDDDVAAMRELKRILKNTGKLIILVPIIDGDVFDEDIGEKDLKERWRRFAQDDHVRLYSKKEFISRLGKANLNVSQLTPSDIGIKSAIKIGVDKNSVLYVCNK